MDDLAIDALTPQRTPQGIKTAYPWTNRVLVATPPPSDIVTLRHNLRLTTVVYRRQLDKRPTGETSTQEKLSASSAQHARATPFS